eukprot:SM000171S03216  [mRNA]  locus=s171:63663:68907:+ [translate_table: standard]
MTSPLSAALGGEAARFLEDRWANGKPRMAYRGEAMPRSLTMCVGLAILLLFVIAAQYTREFADYILGSRHDSVAVQGLDAWETKLGAHSDKLDAILKQLQQVSEDAKQAKEEASRARTTLKQAHLQEPVYSISGETLIGAGDPKLWQQRTFRPHGSYGYVRYAAYRAGPKKLVALGLGDLQHHKNRRVGDCVWKAGDGSALKGHSNLYFPEEHHNSQYEVIIIHCDFMEDLKPKIGGNLVVNIDKEDILLYREDPDEVHKIEVPRGPFKHNITYCSAPAFGLLNEQRILEWVEYHRHLGVDHFIFYDVGALSVGALRLIQPHIDAGLVEISNYQGTLSYNQWWWGQVLNINDCLYRTRFDSQWALYMDLDEYIWLKEGTLADLLDRHLGKPTVTFGSLWYSILRCNPPEDKDERWAVERMPFHWPHIYCQDDKHRFEDSRLCTDYFGHRKYFVNPRLVDVLDIHKSVRPLEGGADLSTDVLRHEHYQGLASRNAKTCTEILKDDQSQEWWMRDYTIANIARAFRAQPFVAAEWEATKDQWLQKVADERNS